MRLVTCAGTCIVAAALAGGSVAAQAGPDTRAGKAAGAFSLSLDSVPQDDKVTTPTGAPAPAEPSAEALPAPASRAPAARFTLDTPIVELIADRRAKAVIDRDLPGLSDDENLRKFQGLSLRRFQPLTGGQLTDALLQQTAADLAAIGPAPSGKGRNEAR